MNLPTRAMLDGLALEVSSRIYDVTSPHTKPVTLPQRLDTLEQALKLTLEIISQVRLELQPPQENPHVQATQH